MARLSRPLISSFNLKHELMYLFPFEEASSADSWRRPTTSPRHSMFSADVEVTLARATRREAKREA